VRLASCACALTVDHEIRATVMALLDGMRTDRVPMIAPRWRRAVEWIDDGLVAEVRYLERTPTGLLRHASARGVCRG
jgi:ATP-dependent DNA ligase